MKLLFLDDSKERWECFRRNRIGSVCEWVQTPASCIDAMLRGFDVVYLDHDLDEENTGCNGTGMDVVNHVVAQPSAFVCTEFVVHSLNYPAAAMMESKLRGAGFLVQRRPWGWRDEQHVEAQRA